MDRAAEALRDLDIPWLRQPLTRRSTALCAELHRLWLTSTATCARATQRTSITTPAQDPVRGASPGSIRRKRCRPPSMTGCRPRGIAESSVSWTSAAGSWRPEPAAAPLRQENRRRRQPDGRDPCPGHEPRQPGHGRNQRYPVPLLEATHQQHLRLSTLKAANDRVSNFIAGLAIFPSTRSIRRSSTAASTARNSRPAYRRSRRGTRASTSAPARAWSPTRCWPTTCRWKRN